MKAVAHLYTYQESDMIGSVVPHLLAEGIDVAASDNWSDDGTYEQLCAFSAQHGPRVTVVRYPRFAPVDVVSWHDMLLEVERFSDEAQRAGYDWVLHHDADEIRRSARPGERLLDALARFTADGYNVVDHRVEVYRPREGFVAGDDPEAYFTERVEDHIDQHNGQIKCWNSGGRRVALAWSGGHTVVFAGMRLAPERFILRHYPLRTKAQSERKIRERRARWAASDRALGFHCQYDHLEGAR